MVGTIPPLVIFLCAAASAAFAFFTFFGSLHSNALQTVGGFGTILDRAGIRAKPEQLVFTWLTVTAVLWIGTDLLFQPSLVIGLLLLPIAAAVSGGLFALYVQHRLKSRSEAFLNQLEMVLRLMSSGLRSGLGFQQTLHLVMDEAKDPARHEFERVVGQTNVGTSVHDALDDLATRIKASETMMMARVIRINAQTGGDLAYVLEQLGNTIRERRRMRRKISSLTAEGRAGAAVLAGVPLFLATFIMLTQGDMARGLLTLPTGHVVLAIVVVLEILGIFSLNRILKVSV